MRRAVGTAVAQPVCMNLMPPRMITLVTAVATATITLALAACGTAPNDSDERAGDPAAAGGLAVVDEDPIDYELCAEISEDVQSLLDATMTCDEDSTCEAMDAQEVLADACLPSISCFVAVADPVELEPVRQELRELDEEYRAECGLCPVAKCVTEERVYSTCNDGTCDVDLRPGAGSTMEFEAAIN